MRKKVLSILFSIVLIFALKNMSYAASANISCDSETTVGKEITITANVTGVQWNLDLKVNGQTIAKNSELENYEANKSVSFSGKYTPNAEGTLNVSLEGTVTEFSDGTTIRNFGTKTIKVKAPENNNSNSNNGNGGNNSSSSKPAAKSTEARLKNLKINPNDFTGFKRDKKEYSVEVPNSTSEVEVIAIAVDSKAKISGTGKVSLKEGSNTVEIVVTAEAGNTETYTLKIKRRTAEEEPQSASDATLKNLGINPKEYDFSGFKKDQTEYSAEVPNEIKTVEIYAEATDSKAQVTGTGEIELNEGANEVKVEVVAQDGTKKTYTITITRKASEVATTSLENTKFGLSDLTIAGQTISPAFKNDVYSYTVGVKEDLSSLDIKATATDSDEKIEIVGNENLQQGENTITIIVKNEKTNQTATYQITVNKNVVSEKQRSFFNPSTWGKEMIIKSIIVAVLVLLIIIAVILKVKISKESKLENGKDNDENSGFPGADELDKAIAEHQGLTENNEENEENKTENYVENNAKTEEKMKEIDVKKNDANASGRRKGKHF